METSKTQKDPDRGCSPAARTGAIKRVADQLDVHPEALRTWVRQAEIEEGSRPGTSSQDAARIAELEREVKELRRANAILKPASAFFAAELDPPLRCRSPKLTSTRRRSASNRSARSSRALTPSRAEYLLFRPCPPRVRPRCP
ncbi:transposase [Streptomyces mirabilis]